MTTLLLRLAGPMQSWGTQSRFSIRDGANEPSKSGVVGLLCAALGRPRSEPVDDLAALRMGVRVDREGVASADYQTAGGTHRRGDTYGVVRADGSRGGTVTSSRHYLADADFLVGLEGDEALLAQVAEALASPHWQVWLGRKSYLPSVPFLDPGPPGALRRGAGLEEALRSEPWPRPGLAVPERAGQRPLALRLVLETPDGRGEDVRRDQPIGAAFATRQFALRTVTTELLTEYPLREAS